MQEKINPLLKTNLPHLYPHQQLILSFLRSLRGDRIYDGIFRDVIYGCKAFYSVTLPKYLGVYEAELHSVLESFLSENFDCYVDIGAAEGYYAVGLASRLPETTTILAYESDEKARELLTENLRLNHLESRVEVLGTCTQEDILKLTKRFKRLFLILDIEGYEEELLAVPGLENVTILVEIHDTREFIINTFGHSHEITLIFQQPRKINSFPRFQQKQLGFWGEIPLPFLKEGRSLDMDNSWAVLVPKS